MQAIPARHGRRAYAGLSAPTSRADFLLYAASPVSNFAQTVVAPPVHDLQRKRQFPEHVGTDEAPCPCRRAAPAMKVCCPVPRMATVASNFHERAMHGSELPPLAFPPISIPCGCCRNEMRLATVDPTNEKTIYTYQCANGHRRSFSTTDPTAISGPGGARNNLRLVFVAGRDWPTIYLGRVLRRGSG
jgi:hypothetical protein